MTAVVTVIVVFRYQLHEIKHSINANDKAHYCTALFAGGGVPQEVAWLWCLPITEILEGTKANLASVCPWAETLLFLPLDSRIKTLGLEISRFISGSQSLQPWPKNYTTSFLDFEALRVGLSSVTAVPGSSASKCPSVVLFILYNHRVSPHSDSLFFYVSTYPATYLRWWI